MYDPHTGWAEQKPVWGSALAAERGVDVYIVLNELAVDIPPGSEGLVVLDYWQGHQTARYVAGK